MRKDVPHAKCSPICAIKESLQALWARAGNCINKVNDVSPDGDGNFSVTGGDNVVIGSTQNGITIDTTGAVAYYTTDDTKLSIDNNDLKISTVGVASTADVAAVAADVTAAEGDILTLQGQIAVNTGDIVTETTNRQNADNTLQGNINTLSGTVTGLSTQIALKRDRSDNVGFYAYTHNGTTQNETAVVDGTTADTMPIRDSAGRMQAADPASGATDKTLTTANWVSQTGDSGPNNLVHRTGNETIGNNKTYSGQIIAQNTIRLSPVTDIRRGIVTRKTNSNDELYFIGNYSDTGALFITDTVNNLTLLQLNSSRLWTDTKPANNLSAIRNIAIISGIPSGGNDGDLVISINNGIYLKSSGTWSKIL